MTGVAGAPAVGPAGPDRRRGAELARLGGHWEANARTDAAFAVLSDPARAGTWDAEAFLATGEHEVAVLVAELERLGLAPEGRGLAIDFGCGLGRLTAALGRRFDAALGIDVSPTMVERARALTPDEHVRFAVNQRDDLALVATGSVDLAYSNIVLQHLSRPLQERYVGELVRVLAPGGVAAFQVPSHRRGVAGFARRHLPEPVVPALRRAVATVRRPHQGFRRTEGEIRMEMHCLPEARVAELVAAGGGEVAAVRYTNGAEADFGGDLRFRTRDEAWAAAARGGYVSPMHVVRRRP